MVQETQKCALPQCHRFFASELSATHRFALAKVGPPQALHRHRHPPPLLLLLCTQDDCFAYSFIHSFPADGEREERKV